MEEEWATNRRAGAAKKQRLPLKDIDSPGSISKEQIDSPDDINMIKKQLKAKTRECDVLKNRILDSEGKHKAVASLNYARFMNERKNIEKKDIVSVNLLQY